MSYAPYPATYTSEPKRCAGGVQTGTRALQDWLCDESPWAADLTDLGTYVCRTIGGTDTLSQHARGAAGDSGHAIVGGASHPSGVAAAEWLVANAGVLGVQEVISDRRRWDNQEQAWDAYGGASPHVDHVHWAQNSYGARYCTRERILSVAPQPPGGFLMALTDAEQQEVLENSRRALSKVVKRAGGNKIFIQTGGTLVEVAPSSSDPVVPKFLFSFGQQKVAPLPTDMFDALLKL